MMHHSGSFTYGSAGHAGQYSAPGAKRFRHEKWNGMPGNYFAHSSETPDFRPNLGFQNRYQRGAPYGQQSGGNFGQQNTGHGFSFGQQGMSYHPDQSMLSSASYYGTVRHPSKPGYLQGAKRSKRGKRGNLNGSRFTNLSTSDLKARILEKLAVSREGGVQVSQLVHMLSCQKKDINHMLYSMQKEGLVDKVIDVPPTWVLKTQANVTAVHSSSQPNSCTDLRISMPATCLNHDASARSVVPLRLQATSSEPMACSMSESFDVIPTAAVRGTDIPPPFACSSWGFDPPKMVINVQNAGLSSSQDDYQQDITHMNVSSGGIFSVSDVPAVSTVNTLDISRQKTLSTSGELLQTVSGEPKKPAGRGRGVLLLNVAKDRLAKTVGGASSVVTSCESDSKQTWVKTERFADDRPCDSGILFDSTNQSPSMSDVNSVDKTNVEARSHDKTVTCQPTVQSELTHYDTVLTSSCKELSGLRADQSLGIFKPPPSPKELLRADPVYKVSTNHSVNFQSRDDITLFLHGKHFGSSFAQNRGTDFPGNTECDSYKSLPDSLSALSFCASSLPSSPSLDCVRKSCMQSRSVDNPFAAALGLEDSYDVSALSSGQMSEGASGLSLTSESFAALNKNSVSALMEYSQSRHVNIEIKCIGSFGPSHRPVYVFVIVPIILCILLCISIVSSDLELPLVFSSSDNFKGSFVMI